ncbi:MAG: ABC transporter ATP-binding protein [Cyanobacteria bacterium P01_A01_bin.40]
MFNSSANKFLFNLIRLEPKYTVSSLILSLCTTTLNLSGTILLIPILNFLLGNQELVSSPENFNYLNIFLFWLNRNQVESSPVSMLFSLLLIIILKNIFDYINVVINFRHTKFLISELKNRAFNLLGKVNLDYYQKNKLSDILAKLNREIDKAALNVKSIQKIVIISLIMLMLMGILVLISWQLTCIFLILISLIIILNNWLKSWVQDSKNLASEKLQLHNFQLIEFLSGMRLIKTVANESAAVKTISQSLQDKDQSQLNTQLIAATIKPITEIGSTLLILAIIAYYLPAQSTLKTTSVLFIYLVVLCRLLPFISQFNQARLQYINTRSSIQVVANFLSESNKSIAFPGKINFSELKADIKFEEVTFAYPQHARIILDKICFQIPQGKTIALVSFSGVEQSVIFDLLARLYEPIAGKILLGGKELQEYDTASLRKAIAIVNPNPFLFNNSLAYNISYGVEHASQADLVNAAKKAQIYQFIEQLPAGFATELGRGIVLSAEQKQKISLARAFLRDPEIVVLQEPIIAADYNNVAPISLPEILNCLCRERTTLIMTKQLNLAQQADQILVFHQGRIKEIGTHEELLRKGAIYQRLLSRQFKTNQQSRQLKLAQKIAHKLAQKTDQSLSPEIRSYFNTLLNQLEMNNAGLFDDEQSQHKILDGSYQSAKDLLTCLRDYARLIDRDLNNTID